LAIEAEETAAAVLVFRIRVVYFAAPVMPKRLTVPKQKPSAQKKKVTNLPPKLTESEQDLLSKMEHGYQLETDSLGGNPVLRRLKDGEVLRPADANASTVKGLRERGLIQPGGGPDPLTTVWLVKRAK